jgi:hypothetical protein
MLDIISALFNGLDLIFGWRIYGGAFAGAGLAIIALAVMGDRVNQGAIAIACLLIGLAAGILWEHLARRDRKGRSTS